MASRPSLEIQQNISVCAWRPGEPVRFGLVHKITGLVVNVCFYKEEQHASDETRGRFVNWEDPPMGSYVDFVFNKDTGKSVAADGAVLTGFVNVAMYM
jgi:hypothetical protein